MGFYGIEIKARREALGLTQVDLGTLLGVPQSTLDSWEKGRRPIPAGIPDELALIERRLDKIVERMIEDAQAVADSPQVVAGDAYVAIAVPTGKMASGVEFDTEGPVLPSAMYRVAAVAAQQYFQADLIEVRLVPADGTPQVIAEIVQ